MEIQALVKQQVTATIEQRIIPTLISYDKKMDRLIDGAQASIYLAAMMAGDPSMGLVGFIPETKSRFEKIEASAIEAAKQYGTLDVRLVALETGVAGLQNGQHRIRRSIKDLCASAVTSNGKWDYVKVAGTVAGTIGAWTVAHPYLHGTMMAVRRGWLSMLGVK